MLNRKIYILAIVYYSHFCQENIPLSSGLLVTFFQAELLSSPNVHCSQIWDKTNNQKKKMAHMGNSVQVHILYLAFCGQKC